jgi:hypothetical protein
MTNSSRQGSLFRSLGKLAVGACLLGAAALPALAEDRPFLASASIVRVLEPVQLSGGHFKPNQALTLYVRIEGGTEVAHNAVSDAKGDLSQSVPVSGAGVHIVRVTDSGGRVLARAQFVVIK